MYTLKFTSQFKRDVKLAKKQHKNIDKLFRVIDMITQGDVLPSNYRDHALTGNYHGFRECHIEPDWLLVYEIRHDILVLTVTRVGSHSDLFKK